jgi:hypothetical protein
MQSVLILYRIWDRLPLRRSSPGELSVSNAEIFLRIWASRAQTLLYTATEPTLQRIQ